MAVDFFTLGGHSLLAMKLTVQSNRVFKCQVTSGQIVVAFTIEQLSALLESTDGEQLQRLGFEALLPLHEGHGPTLFCFHPASGFAWQFSVLSRYPGPQWLIIGIQSPRRDGSIRTMENLNAVYEYHLTTLLSQQPYRPHYLLGYSLGDTLAQGIAMRLYAGGETVASLGLLGTWPPKMQNQQEKEVNGLDPAVLAEIKRECEASLTVQQGNTSEILFNAIEGNYAGVVRLLTTTHSVPLADYVTLFAAERTLILGVGPKRNWSPWVSSLDVYCQDCAYVDITSPTISEVIGPVISTLVNKPV